MPWAVSSAAKRCQYGLTLATYRQPDFPPNGSLFRRGECLGIIRPKRSETRCADLLNCVDQALIVAHASSAITLLSQIVADKTLEVAELAVRDKDGGLRTVVLLSDV